ncbi:MAG: hypothetical protein EOR67_20365 [Mesorhizobium sp.]|nr:MAG: hypothetical protein EOR69_21965 [Mesorhizobium sp.]RWL85799.1 MAG: hypothetical protein EOR67_20365 [Mesorhizobium sp.]RWL93465.1 MAG: hypothetical protein EOR70_28500 [Mesorhizobium sp.]
MRPACKWRPPALPVLTYFKYAPLRSRRPPSLVASRPSSTPTRPDLNPSRWCKIAAAKVGLSFPRPAGTSAATPSGPA